MPASAAAHLSAFLLLPLSSITEAKTSINNTTIRISSNILIRIYGSIVSRNIINLFPNLTATYPNAPQKTEAETHI